MGECGEAFYEAFKAKDARFDGRFFVGVKSTGIYCRPVCRARLPKRENCVFYKTAAEAESNGFRPCLMCRPELAPGLSATDAESVLAQRAARYIEQGCGEGLSLEALASRLGYTSRHLRRVFYEEYHVSLVEYTQTCRLLLAKGLLTDSALSVTDTAMAAGFGSVRRFNDLFKRKYRLSPSAFRKTASAHALKSGTITVSLGYRPPYDFDGLLNFLAARAIPHVEAVRGGVYMRTVHIGDSFGCITVANEPQKCVLKVTLSEWLLPVLPQVLGRVRRLFDLYCEPSAVSAALKSIDGILPNGFTAGIRVPGCFDIFELCTRAILGQQITVKAAGTLTGKLVKQLGTPVETGIDGIDVCFPSAREIAEADWRIEDVLGPLGIIATRARAIKSLAELYMFDTAEFEFCQSPQSVMKKLEEIRGVGAWTASYIAMRALGYTDAFLETDLAIRKAFGGKKLREIREISQQWSPWRSYATMALWNAF